MANSSLWDYFILLWLLWKFVAITYKHYISSSIKLIKKYLQGISCCEDKTITTLFGEIPVIKNAFIVTWHIFKELHLCTASMRLGNVKIQSRELPQAALPSPVPGGRRRGHGVPYCLQSLSSWLSLYFFSLIFIHFVLVRNSRISWLHRPSIISIWIS